MINRIHTIWVFMEFEAERQCETERSNNHINYYAISMHRVASKCQLLRVDSGDRVMNNIGNILFSWDLHFSGIGRKYICLIGNK